MCKSFLTITGILYRCQQIALPTYTDKPQTICAQFLYINVHLFKYPFNMYDGNAHLKWFNPTNWSLLNCSNLQQTVSCSIALTFQFSILWLHRILFQHRFRLHKGVYIWYASWFNITALVEWFNSSKNGQQEYSRII